MRAVLTALGGVLGDYMEQERSVRLDGIGSFYFTAATNKNGIATEKELLLPSSTVCVCASFPRPDSVEAAREPVAAVAVSCVD